MRTAARLFFALALAVPLVAQTNAIRFDPPDPTSSTDVIARFVTNYGCSGTTADVTRNGNIIDVTLHAPNCPPDTRPVPPLPTQFAVDLGVLPAGVYHVVVSPPALLIALAEGTLVVRDANPPFEVLPNVAFPTSTLTLSAPGIANCTAAPDPQPAVCEHIDVRIGDTPATVISTSSNAITVRVPGTLAPGTYDVTIARTHDVLTAHGALNVVGNTSARESAFFERVLFPVYFSGAGAFGAQWRTEASLYNGNEFAWPTPLTLFSAPCLIEVCTSYLAAGQTVIVAVPEQSTVAGVVETMPRQAAANADFNLRIRDVTRDAQDLGTEIPVVREDELYGRTFNLLNVPSDARYRITLRLYDLNGPSAMNVRVFAVGSSTPLLTQTVALSAQQSLNGGGFAIVNDLLHGLPATANASTPLRVEIAPSAATAFAHSAWGFISATNNDTQHVTVISPQ